MGDETILIASRFSRAVGELSVLARDASRTAPGRAEGAKLKAAVGGAIDAIATVYEAGTDAVRDWPERRRRVLAQLAAMRRVLDRSGVDGELRRMAGALVELIEPGGTRR